MSHYDELPEAASKPIAIRLNPKNPRESRALEVLARYGDNRRAIVEGLLCLDDRDQRLDEVASMQREALDILQKLENGTIQMSSGPGQPEQAPEELANSFKVGLKKLARPIRRIDEQGE